MYSKELKEAGAWNREQEEHDYLDLPMGDIPPGVGSRPDTTPLGVPVLPDLEVMNMDKVNMVSMEEEIDWETEADRELEMWAVIKDTVEDDKVCNMMSMYLTNTNLISKRMIGATSSVESHGS